MKGHITDATRKKTARLAGLLWFLSAVTGGFGIFYVQYNIIVIGDPVATAANMVAFESLFRAAIVSNLFSQIFLFFFGLIMFQIFKEINKVLATVFFSSILMTVAIAFVNTLNNFGALLVLSQVDYLKAFNHEQLIAMAMIFRKLNNFGQGLLEIFWTPFYFSFGVLIIRSKFLPRIFGPMLMIMSVGYFINVFTKFLIPQFHPEMFTRLAMTLGVLGGIPTILWILIKGVKVQPSAAS